MANRKSIQNIQIRPIYHRIKRRIEAHICIAFLACKLFKELERILTSKKSDFSPEMVIDILNTIYEITIISPYSMNTYKKIIIKNQEQKELLGIFGV